jgi:protein-tyrosine-phosphatase
MRGASNLVIAPRVLLLAAASALCGLTVAIPASAKPQAAAAAVDGMKPPTVLFMCPHGAAKSVLASAYFQRLARERGLNVRVVSAGTEPDRQVAPAVATHLTKNGYEVPIANPRKVTVEEFAAADVVVSIGCDLKDLPAPRGELLKWDDVASPSEDFARADEQIRERVVKLIEELVRRQHDARGGRFEDLISQPSARYP